MDRQNVQNRKIKQRKIENKYAKKEATRKEKKTERSKAKEERKSAVQQIFPIIQHNTKAGAQMAFGGTPFHTINTVVQQC